jgi:hypothetical protein
MSGAIIFDSEDDAIFHVNCGNCGLMDDVKSFREILSDEFSVDQSKIISYKEICEYVGLSDFHMIFTTAIISLEDYFKIRIASVPSVKLDMKVSDLYILCVEKRTLESEDKPHSN